MCRTSGFLRSNLRQRGANLNVWTQSDPWRRLRAGLLCGLAIIALAACSSGAGHVQDASGQSTDPATIDFPIFYVKRYSVPLQPDANDLRMLRFAVPSADLFMRSNASPSGTEVNLTKSITGTGTTSAANYDIKDVSASADGTTILFAMRGPLTANMDQTKAPSWRIWQYVIATATLSLVVNAATDPDPATVNDIAPQFLPDGRIVFSSTRQRQSQGILLDEGMPQFIAEDEARTEPAFVVHVMNGDGTNIHQVSFNQSHDRDPTVLANGRIMWSRWDDAPPAQKGMHLYSANPDGTDLQLLYGANSHATGTTADGANNATIEFVKTHEMADGRILALIRPYTYPAVNDWGGALIIIDTTDYVENTQPAVAGSGFAGPAQTRATTNPVLTVPGPSPGGRFYGGFPLWDGTGRIIVSWSQCRLLNTSVTPNTVTACTAAALAAPNAQSAPPVFSLWMFDPTQNTMQPIMQPTDGIMITDVVAAQPRTLPAEIVDQQPGVTLDQDMYDNGVGEIDIRSVYDIDGVDTAVPNIAGVADPLQTPPDTRKARFLRIEKAVSIPDQKTLNLPGTAFGATNYMREILGYAPIQPDGSVLVQVPAQVAFMVSVLDANGRRISPVHDSWLQLQPGETVQCNGCHTPASAQMPAAGQTAVSHGRKSAFNAVYPGGTAGAAFADSVSTYASINGTEPLVPTNQGETMAETLHDATCAGDSPRCLLDMPTRDVLYTDLWTNTAVATAGTPIAYTYQAINAQFAAATSPTWTPPTNAGCLVVWTPTCRIIINYTEQIQPLWTLAPRTGPAGQNVTCTQGGCHSPAAANGTPLVPAGTTQLDLTASTSQTMPPFLTSYVDLLFSHDEQTVNMGALQELTVPGPVDPTTGQPTQVPVALAPPAVAGSANASVKFFGVFAPGGSHVGYLSPSELRLVSEWLDIGAQYFNNPFDPAALNN
jgi:Hydrazine synthase alpha subunit middle domain/WD40-like Beta Propeller Repeat